MIEKPGIYPDIAPSLYFADPLPKPSLTQSIAKILIEQSPRHAMIEHPRLRVMEPIEDEAAEKYVAAQAIGNAAHMLMTGRGRDIVVAPYDSWRKDEAKKVRGDAEASGKLPILEKHMNRAKLMVLSARKQLLDRDMEAAFSAGTGTGECCIVACENGIWLRSLVDFLQNDRLIVWDYKTTERSVAPHGIAAIMVRDGWDVQAAMHERILDLLDPQNAGRRKHRFVVQEQDDPHALTVCELPESTMQMGRKKLDYAVTKWAICLARGEWPLYPAQIVYPEYPGYAESAWLNREIHDAATERAPTNLLLAG